MQKHRIARRLVVFATSVIVGAGCLLVISPRAGRAQDTSATGRAARKKKPHKDHEHYDPPSSPPPTRSRGQYPSSLDHPLSYYTETSGHDGPSEFLTVVRGIGWNGYDRKRKCKGGEGCTAAQTWMRVQAADGANNVPFTNMKPGQLAVVGRLENIGLYHDIIYSHLPRPQDNNNLIAEGYYVVEGTPNGTIPVFATLQFQQVNGTWRWTLDTTSHADSRPFKPCDSEHHSVAVGDFKAKCKLAREDKGAFLITDQSDALAWFSCAEGCCGSSFPRKEPKQGGDRSMLPSNALGQKQHYATLKH